MNVKIISAKSCSIKHSGKLSEQDIGIFRLKTACSSFGPLARQKWWEEETFVRVSEGSPHLAEVFCHFAFPRRFTTGNAYPGSRRGACSCPAGLPATKRRACGSPTANRGEGGALLPLHRLGSAAPATSAPRFHEHHRPETTSIYTSSAFAHPDRSPSPFPLSRVNRDCLHPQPAGSLPCKTWVFGVQKPQCMLVTVLKTQAVKIHQGRCGQSASFQW